MHAPLLTCAPLTSVISRLVCLPLPCPRSYSYLTTTPDASAEGLAAKIARDFTMQVGDEAC